jgi:hypothetical protein
VMAFDPCVPWECVAGNEKRLRRLHS